MFRSSIQVVSVLSTKKYSLSSVQIIVIAYTMLTLRDAKSPWLLLSEVIANIVASDAADAHWRQRRAQRYSRVTPIGG